LSSDVARAWRRGKVGLLWIDGAHDAESVLADIDGWLPHVCDQGLIYIHDAYSAIGTTKALLQRFFFSNQVSYIGADHSLMMFRKEHQRLVPRVRSAGLLLVRLPYFFHNIAIKLANRRHWHLLSMMLARPNDECLF